MRILLKNGLLYDGSSEKPRRENLWIENDRIVAVGDLAPWEPERTVDCEGLCVAPGFIDAHSHNDFFYDLDDAERYYRPFLSQGITTQVTGNCGFSPFGVEKNSAHMDAVGGGLFRAREPGSYADFKRRAEGRLFVNLAPLIGHGTARISVSGLSPRALTAEEMERELAIAEEALRGGAFGGSFGFMYEPGMYAPHAELVAFAQKIAEFGGILTVHPRACSRVAMGYPLLSRPHIEQALDEVIDIMRESGVHTEYSHLIFVGETSWKSAEPMLAKFYAAREKGFDIAYDNYSFLYGASVITVICPPWYMALPKEKRASRLNRLKLRAVVDVTRKLLGIDYEDITVAYISPEAKQYEGRNVAEIARTEGCDPLDLYLRLIDLSDGHGSVYLSKYYNDAILRRLMEDELSVFMTDAWVEGAGVQNGAAFQCYPNFLLKAKEWGIPTEKVVHKMTGAIAQRFCIPERGLLKPGYFADVTVFDPNGLKVDLQTPDFHPEGICHVLVNGAFAVENGQYVSQRAGRVLQKG